ncbi:unnamed protein product [Candidula unifasciata]|uniref:Uncharacterized protein n=1 Tax=Candidula unifasciata TaxID=100452 RepID=A0A8S3ZAE9_9EUPU|nr:unnamed protein product [Candidula unifasciata]
MQVPSLGGSSFYLKRNLKDVLPRALNEVCQARPRDPIEFLARCLYKAADCDLYFQEKAIFEAEKRMLEIQLKREEQQRQTAMLRYKKQISEHRDFLHIGDKKGKSSVEARRYNIHPRHRRHPVSTDKKKDSVDQKEGRRETARLSFFQGREFGSTLESTPINVSPESETLRSASRGASGASPTKSSIFRKGGLPAGESRSVVSVQRDSRSSSRTLEDDVLERNPSTLTSSSRTISRLASFGDEINIRDSRSPPSDLYETGETPKRDSLVRRTPRRKSKTVGDETKQIRSRSGSVVKRKKKTKQRSSSTDLTLGSFEVEDKGKLKDDSEAGVSSKRRRHKKRGSIKPTNTDNFQDGFPENMTMEEIYEWQLEDQTKKTAEETRRARGASKRKKSVDKKKSRTVEQLKVSKETGSDEERESDESASDIQGKPDAHSEEVSDDEDAEQRRRRKEEPRQQALTEQEEYELQRMTGVKKTKRRVADATKRSTRIKEFPKGEEEHGQEDTATVSRRINVSDSKLDKDVKRRHRRRITKTGTESSDAEESLESARRSRMGTPPPTREMSLEDTVRKRASKKSKQHRRRSFSKRKHSLGESESMRSFGQTSDISDTETVDYLSDTSHRPSDRTTFAITEEEYAYPFTPVECEWLLLDSNTLVCRHPVLGDIRSRPQSNSYALDVSAWADRENYNWRAIYDHEIYVVVEPYIEDYRFKRKHK